MKFQASMRKQLSWALCISVLAAGCIQFKDDKSAQLRFDINVAAAEEGKLSISSRILQLARNKKTEASK